MGKNKRRQIDFYDPVHKQELQCDSNEECDFLEWCIEAYNLGIIKDFIYQPEPILLSESINYQNIDGKTKNLFREHIYSPDFKLTFKPKDYSILAKEFKVFKENTDNDVNIYIDVKGTFMRQGGGRAFSINQKWVYQKTGIYIYKLIPKDFFKVCGCPQVCFMTKKTKKHRKMFTGYKQIKDIFN